MVAIQWDLVEAGLKRAEWQTVRNRQGKVTRSSAWYTGYPCTCQYKYGKGAPWDSVPMPEWMISLCDAIGQLLGTATPNAVNLNRYDDAEQELWWHADNEDLFINERGEADIVSLSVGFARSFEVCENFTDDVKSTILADRDILRMSGKTQLYYQHRVPPASRHASTSSASLVRYNLTFRHICNHTKKCAC
jgi:alkylated DNA repair dioxygenase AlkB